MKLLKKLMAIPTPLEMAAKELVEAQRAKLKAESAMEYALSVVDYNDARIKRLRMRMNELQGEQG